MKPPSMQSMRHSLFFALAFVVIFTFMTIQDRGLFAGDPVRVSEECQACHEGYDTGLESSPHQLGDVADGAGAAIACTDCHMGDARHYEEDPEAYPMSNPAKTLAFETAQVCAACHMNSHQQNMMEDNVHAESGVSCSGCHMVHDSDHPSLLQSEESSLCLSCHSDVEAQFAQPYRHPVNDDIVQCSECHLTLDLTSTELSLNGSNACMDCHAEFSGPFPFEHQATVDYSTEEGGCINCHAPHGSSLPRMLTQPFEPPHYQLCSQCHSVPRHNNNTQHGTAFAGAACNDCHTDVHGSYTSRKFFGEAMRDLGCFNSGCHQF